MGGALGVVLTGDTVPVEGRAAVPVYVDDSLPIVGPSRACVVVTSGPMAGGPAIPVRIAPSGTPAIGPALPVYVVAGGGSLSTADATMAYTNKVKALNPIAYWPLAESSGATITDESGNSRNGTYSNVTLGQTGIGDGRTSASFNGTTSFGNVYSASLNGAFNNQECTIAIWIKVSAAGVWTDGTGRDAIRIGVNGSNYFEIARSSTNNRVNCVYNAGGTLKNAPINGLSSTGWIHLAITVSKSGDALKAYLNGTQSGATVTGLGVWAGALAATACCVGAFATTPTAVWSGTLAHAAVWASPLSAAQIATLAVVP